MSLHAELVGRELLKRSHTIKVFAPYLQSAGRWWHHKLIREDEDFVERIYSELSPDGEEGHLDVDKVLKEDFDFLLVESYEKMPYRDTEQLIKKLKEKGIPSLAVIHEGTAEDIKYDLSLFDAVVVFDGRYREEVIAGKVPEEKVYEIPYPCLPPVERERKFADDGRIVFFSFGRQPIEEYEDFVAALREIHKRFSNIVYRVVRAGQLLEVSDPWIVQEERILDIDEIYRYLLSSDFHLLPKGNTRRVVVSSTFYQTVGSLCITVSRDSRFFETHKREGSIILYEDRGDLVVKLTKAIEDETFREEVRRSAYKLALHNSVKRITDRFEELINSIVVKNGHNIV